MKIPLKDILSSYVGNICLTAGSILVSIVSMLLISPFAFVPFILRSDSEITVTAAFRKSLRIMRGQFLHIWGFIIFAGGTNLIILSILTVVVTLIPLVDNSAFAMLNSIMSFVLLVTRFRVMVRCTCAVPLYYFATTGKVTVHKSEYKAPVTLPDTADSAGSAIAAEDGAVSSAGDKLDSENLDSSSLGTDNSTDTES